MRLGPQLGPRRPEAHLPLDSSRRERSPAGLVTCSPAEVVVGRIWSFGCSCRSPQGPGPHPVAGARSPCEPPPGRARTPGAPGLPLLLRGGLVLGDSVGSCGDPMGRTRPSIPAGPVPSRPLAPDRGHQHSAPHFQAFVTSRMCCRWNPAVTRRQREPREHRHVVCSNNSFTLGAESCSRGWAQPAGPLPTAGHPGCSQVRGSYQ